MESLIFKYINFLLPRHNYIIIPDFGGFITNVEPAKLTSNGIKPPIYRISFNKELGHDDGILISHIYKSENIPYNTAAKKVKDAVMNIKKTLHAERCIDCGNIGKLELDDYNNIIFTANPMAIHPELLGLTHTEIHPLAYISHSIRRNKGAARIKRILGSTAAVAATILLFIAPSTNIIDNTTNTNSQQAGFIHSLANSFKNPTSSQITKEVITPSSIITIDDSNTENEITEEKAKPLRSYHIIIGGDDTNERASALLKKIQSSGFPHAEIIESGDRFRISAATFEDKKTAENFLEDFRKENPKYETAWLFSTRNK